MSLMSLWAFGMMERFDEWNLQRFTNIQRKRGANFSSEIMDITTYISSDLEKEEEEGDLSNDN